MCRMYNNKHYHIVAMALQQYSALFLFFFFLSLSFFSTTKTALAAPPPKHHQESDRISMLPGQPPVNFAQFSGYVTVNEDHGRALFYWLTEATDDAADKPLVLWLNGGPGCSSIAYGASEEIGPFRINSTAASLYLNEYSWNTEANLLFLESPAGVGYSYTNTSSDLKDSGDKRTARDALIFLIRWMSRFPQYKYRDFYISGESYAGHYVPQLALQIHEYNKKHSQTFINLKGLIVGNAVTDTYYDGIGTITYWWSHSMISDRTYKTLLKYCKFKPANVSSTQCDNVMNYAMNHEFGKIDQYSIYTPACSSSEKTQIISSTLRNILIGRGFLGYDPCTEKYAEKYYNRPDVQKALHANLTGIPYKWTACSDVLLRNWKDTDDSMLSTYRKLIAAGLRIWVFSGDTDSVVPVTATRFALSHLNLKIKTRWYPWYAGGQVGGWTEVYKGLTFATVRGAGHEVPLIQPRRGFVLFQTFLSGKDLPKS